MKIGDITHPDDAAMTADARAKILAGDENAAAQEKRYVRKDGQTVWGRVSRLLIKDETGKPVFFIGQTLDINRQKHAEAERQLSEQNLQDFANSAADRFWEMDPEFRYNAITDAQSRDSQIASDELVGRTRWEFPGIDVDADIWNAHRALLDAHKPFRNFDYQRNMPDGTAIWIRSNSVPIFDEAGQFSGYRGTNSDITETKLAEASRNQFLETVEALDVGVALWDADQKLAGFNSAY